MEEALIYLRNSLQKKIRSWLVFITVMSPIQERAFLFVVLTHDLFSAFGGLNSQQFQGCPMDRGFNEC